MYEWDASVIEDADGVRVGIEYDADLFDAATVDRALADYEALLAGIAAPGGNGGKGPGGCRLASMAGGPAGGKRRLSSARRAGGCRRMSAEWADRFSGTALARRSNAADVRLCMRSRA